MSSTNIFLILISGLGVLHGMFLAAFLWLYKKGKHTSNKLLSLLLLLLSLRVGKSVFLQFAEALEVQFIFTGLAILMAIGPLFYLYTRSLVKGGFQLRTKYLAHFIPAILGVFCGILMTKELVDTTPTLAFVVMFLVYYGHYLLYLLFSYRLIAGDRNPDVDAESYFLLRLLFYSLLAIWFVYVLNLFDDVVPYLLGPILYTVVAYTISFVIIKKGLLKAGTQPKYKTTSVSEEQVDLLFTKVLKLILKEKQFKDAELSLKSLSEQLHVSTQTLSMVINRQSKSNFNSFINHYRIEEAIVLLQNEAYDHQTIASIAFEVGFNSISSFNTAFKKQTGSTPMAFRKALVK